MIKPYLNIALGVITLQHTEHGDQIARCRQICDMCVSGGKRDGRDIVEEWRYKILAFSRLEVADTRGCCTEIGETPRADSFQS